MQYTCYKKCFFCKVDYSHAIQQDLDRLENIQISGVWSDDKMKVLQKHFLTKFDIKWLLDKSGL